MTCPFTFFEFFAGGGMARVGLEGWTCLFANDLSVKKAAAYRSNWGDDDLHVGDIHEMGGVVARVARAAPQVDLVWGSSPCQDLSLAGARAGLQAPRSGAFFGLMEMIWTMCVVGRRPSVVVLENVMGLLSGDAFGAIVRRFIDQGYRVGALAIDAADFTPQSRQRLFFVALAMDAKPPKDLVLPHPDPVFAPAQLIQAVEGLPAGARGNWVWWSLPRAPRRATMLADLIEDLDEDHPLWADAQSVERHLAMLAPAQEKAFSEMARQAARSGVRRIAPGFRRTRLEGGRKVQRFELRFDGVAGCLRTGGGGSSVQRLVFVEQGRVRMRPFTSREMARLMGLPDGYRLPASQKDACDLLGDGVVVPVVNRLSEFLLKPLAALPRDRTASPFWEDAA